MERILETVDDRGVKIIYDLDIGTRVAIIKLITSDGIMVVDEAIVPDTVIDRDTEFEVTKFSLDAAVFNHFKKITLPNKISNLRPRLFKDCTYLEYINLPDHCEVIDSECFRGCKRLKEVEITENSRISTLYPEAFVDCWKLRKFKLPEKCTQIMLYACAFSSCGLDEFTFPNNSLIYSGAFRYCRNLKKVVFKKNLPCDTTRHISPVFPRNKNLIIELGDLEFLMSIYGGPKELEKQLHKYRTSLWNYLNFERVPGMGLVVGPKLNEKLENTYSGKIYIPKYVVIGNEWLTIKKIEDFAFSDCPDLKSVKIHNSIKFNKDLAFYNTNCKVDVYYD